jgi:hypothetical protein
MKWVKNGTRGIVVASAKGKGNDLTQLHCPSGTFVDAAGSVYATKSVNDRVTCCRNGEIR